MTRLGVAGVPAPCSARGFCRTRCGFRAAAHLGYLLLVGVFILLKAWRLAPARDAPAPWVGPIGFVAGFLDASGGGGWGPVATSTLVGSGHAPRMAVGSVNTTEFFVTVAAATTFFVELGASPWRELLALIIGGLLAAPLGGWAVKHILGARADGRGRLPGDRAVGLADRARAQDGVSARFDRLSPCAVRERRASLVDAELEEVQQWICMVRHDVGVGRQIAEVSKPTDGSRPSCQPN